jgi:hypothetical protein
MSFVEISFLLSILSSLLSLLSPSLLVLLVLLVALALGPTLPEAGVLPCAFAATTTVLVARMMFGV